MNYIFSCDFNIRCAAEKPYDQEDFQVSFLAQFIRNQGGEAPIFSLDVALWIMPAHRPRSPVDVDTPELFRHLCAPSSAVVRTRQVTGARMTSSVSALMPTLGFLAQS
jgi:hypothetical protein